MSDPHLQSAHGTELDSETVLTIAARLDAMDRSRRWTRDALRLIAEHESLGAVELAELLGREVLRLKTDVRRLKTLGLVERLDAGHRITPRGLAFLNAEATASDARMSE